MIDPLGPTRMFPAPARRSAGTLPALPRRAVITLVVCLALTILAIAVRLMVGGPGSSFAWPSEAAIFDLRAQRALCGLIVGAALAVAGVKLQCLLRNPLASPDLLGLASGAGLGIILAIYLTFRATGHISPSSLGAIPALLGSLGALGLVFALSQRRGLIDPITLVLIGVVVSIMCAAASMFIEQLLPDQGAAARRWLLGALRDDATPSQLYLAGGATLLATILGASLGPAMDAASLGEDEAISVGVPLRALRAMLFISAGVLAAASVTLAGPIGFVGLICPHVIRLAAGPSHRPLIIGAALAGATLVIASDSLVKAFSLGSGRLPINVITSLIGGPALVIMLRRHMRQ